MDGVSAAVSIFALIEATALVSKAFRGLKGAKKEIKKLERELAVLYSLLLILKTYTTLFQTLT